MFEFAFNPLHGLARRLRYECHTAQEMRFSIKDFFSNCDQIRTADLVTYTEEILNGKLHFLCCEETCMR